MAHWRRRLTSDQMIEGSSPFVVNIFLEFHEDIILMEGGATKWLVAAWPNGEGV